VAAGKIPWPLDFAQNSSFNCSMINRTADIQIYCNYMEEVRTRIAVVQAVLDGGITTGIEGCNNELIFLQLRKTLEVIAFASLSANKDKYSQAHANFAQHWKPAKMLDTLEKINSNFYPLALEPFEVTSAGVKHFPPATDGFMTKNEFISLYNTCSDVLHKQNPYSKRDPTIFTGYSVQVWVHRIRRLLACHSVELANRDLWVVIIPNSGSVQVVHASPSESGLPAESSSEPL
jgi:hypothetical protein